MTYLVIYYGSFYLIIAIRIDTNPLFLLYLYLVQFRHDTSPVQWTTESVLLSLGIIIMNI